MTKTETFFAIIIPTTKSEYIHMLPRRYRKEAIADFCWNMQYRVDRKLKIEKLVFLHDSKLRAKYWKILKDYYGARTEKVLVSW